ncbi:MAG: hypothetical protein JW875_02525 [Spirochaetales bacterium]|nr:hypothetical protein [Spirochaetales bacterium]
MKNVWYAVVAALFVLSCSLDLEPVKEGGSITLTLPALTDASGAEGTRAVIQGSGYVYVRPLGRITSKPYYGPYKVQTQTAQGSVIKITDIPSGTYEGFAVLHTAEAVDNLTVTVDGASMPLSSVLSLPDTRFREVVTARVDGLTLFDRSLGNAASFAISAAVTVRSGGSTPLTLSLIPATNVTVTANIVSTVTFTSESLHRSFVRVTGLKNLFSGFTAEGSSLKISILNKNTAAIGMTAAVYRADGSLAPSAVLSSFPLDPGVSGMVTAPWNGDDECYLYIESQGLSLGLSCEASVSDGVVLRLDLPGSGIVNGQTATVYVLSRALTEADFSTTIWPRTVCDILALATYTATVNGESVSGIFKAPASTALWKPSSATSGYIYLLVDDILYLAQSATIDSLQPLGQPTLSIGTPATVTASNPKRHDEVLFQTTGGAFSCDGSGDYFYNQTFTNPQDVTIYLFSGEVSWYGVWALENPLTHPHCIGYGKPISAIEWQGKLKRGFTGDVWLLVSGTYGSSVIRYRSSDAQTIYEPGQEIVVDMNNNLYIALLYYARAVSLSQDGDYTVAVFDEDNYLVGSGMGTAISGTMISPLFTPGTEIPVQFTGMQLTFEYTHTSTSTESKMTNTRPEAIYLLLFGM